MTQMIADRTGSQPRFGAARPRVHRINTAQLRAPAPSSSTHQIFTFVDRCMSTLSRFNGTAYLLVFRNTRPPIATAGNSLSKYPGQPRRLANKLFSPQRIFGKLKKGTNNFSVLQIDRFFIYPHPYFFFEQFFYRNFVTWWVTWFHIWVRKKCLWELNLEVAWKLNE